MTEPVVPDPTATVKSEPEPELETLAVESGGKKLVPLEAVAKLRAERRELKEKADRLAAVETELGQWKTYGEQARPVLEHLKKASEANPRFLDDLMGKKADPDPPDPTLVELAKTLDLYDSRGQPDLARAQKIHEINQASLAKLIDAQVEPLKRTSAVDKAAAHYQWARAFRLPDGTKPDSKYIDWAWSQLAQHPEVAANPQAAQTALLYALGAERVAGAKVKPPPEEPLEVESGGSGRRAPLMGEAQHRVAKSLGISAEEFATSLKTVIDRGGVLE